MVTVAFQSSMTTLIRLETKQPLCAARQLSVLQCASRAWATPTRQKDAAHLSVDHFQQSVRTVKTSDLGRLVRVIRTCCLLVLLCGDLVLQVLTQPCPDLIGVIVTVH